MYPSSSQQLPHFTKSGASCSSLSEANAAAMASECYQELSLQAESANVIGLVDHCTRLGFRFDWIWVQWSTGRCLERLEEGLRE